MQDKDVTNKLLEVYKNAIAHDGYSSFRVDIKILKRDKKEVIIDAGLQYRFVVEQCADTEKSFNR
jgi:hypothetical protein